jgi:diguanylate cyclase (GGDEF)-like protein
LAHGQAQTRAQQAEHSLQQVERKIFSLERQALRDSLTGVYNRRFLLEALQKEVARSCRDAKPIGLLFVDVDAFKPLNDTWGHLVGDIVLGRVAQTLGSVLRGGDILARYGGEEFVVLPNDPDEKGIVQLGERLRLAVEQLVTKVEGVPVTVTISVGCTLTVPTRNDLDLGPQLLASADAAMYDAKQLGRNRVVFRSMLDQSERELMQRTIDCSFSRWLVSRNILSSQTIDSLWLDYSPQRLPLGELAIDTGLLTDKQVSKILDLQVDNEERFGALALEQKYLTPEQLAMLLARQRENPIQLTRMLIGKHLLEESQAQELVKEYLASLK